MKEVRSIRETIEALETLEKKYKAKKFSRRYTRNYLGDWEEGVLKQDSANGIYVEVIERPIDSEALEREKAQIYQELRNWVEEKHKVKELFTEREAFILFELAVFNGVFQFPQFGTKPLEDFYIDILGELQNKGLSKCGS